MLTTSAYNNAAAHNINSNIQCKPAAQPHKKSYIRKKDDSHTC